MANPSFHPAQVQASTLSLPVGPWRTVFECLCEHFPNQGAPVWRERFAAGKVLDAHGQAMALDHPYRAGLRVHYFREVPGEAPIPVQEHVLHVDEHLVVADKPHFLPVTPGGQYVEQTLLRRLIRRLGNPHLVPLHRIDRHTAGLVMFSANPSTRARYQSLFPQRRIHKHYEAVAPALPQLAFPYVHRSRMVRGEPFFRMAQTEGPANSETLIEVIERGSDAWRYGLSPVTGKTHQLRVHMAALGAPLRNDPFYPQVLAAHCQADLTRPLQLLARALRFNDPLNGTERYFCSELALLPL
ncbi:pseudouridine synthase [Pseudomonas typographi]|uniref:Pseudouridine synthase n=1 Tax=Pseudomonas typographi TaxID=2715964 RepID=A0ABR7Z4J9_9PSED|nr:pseudouridine synthase [Pseudomonas typographi]MBD1553239.1 pseudouridine synthase [Pseudomonas typographi]MBD1588119.1 pseudouridine synthase [Pseudomonas typographi]MBD1600347.1 pseudouridine synthase [Pseudomonas typographi]